MWPQWQLMQCIIAIKFSSWPEKPKKDVNLKQICKHKGKLCCTFYWSLFYSHTRKAPTARSLVYSYSNTGPESSSWQGVVLSDCLVVNYAINETHLSPQNCWRHPSSALTILSHSWEPLHFLPSSLTAVLTAHLCHLLTFLHLCP